MTLIWFAFQFLGVCSTPPDLCLVSEWLHQGDVQQLLRRKRGRLSFSSKLKLALGVAAGMNHLHAEGILHCVRIPFIVAKFQDKTL
jgi:serine/threonine protein kinase